TKLCVEFHNFAHQGFDYLLANRTVLAARQICHCFCKRGNYFISVDSVWLPRHCRILGEKILDQFDHRAVEARALFGVLGFWHGRLLLTAHTTLHLWHSLPRLQGAKGSAFRRLRHPQVVKTVPAKSLLLLPCRCRAFRPG